MKFSTAILFFVAANAYGQIGDPKSPLPATQPEPTNLAVATGRYIASVEQLNVLKASPCGYALKRTIPTYEAVIRDEILPAFPKQKRDEVANALAGMKNDVVNQGKNLFNGMYTYYTKTEGLDHNTACGMITAGFITMRKMSAEAFARKALAK